MRRVLLPLALATALAGASLAPASALTPDAAIARWSSTTELAKGTLSGAKVASGAVTIGTPRSSLTYDDPWGSKRTWQAASWISPWQSVGFDATHLVPSWSATVPKDTWLHVAVRVRKGSTYGSWDNVARWAPSTDTIHRASDTAQADDLAKVNVDTVVANAGKRFDRYQVRVLLLRKPGTKLTPTLRSVSAIASSYGSRTQSTSATTMTAAKTLAVPRYSQMIHKGHSPQWGGGGEAWCSPTSTAMVLSYFGTGPTKANYAWASGPDPMVDHAARFSYDHRYRGTGNWPFTTGYAGHYGNDAFVTRLWNLRDAEKFIKAGIPLVASVAFGRGELSGSPISSTPGHLMVVVGFTKSGAVVVNDPAAASNGSVRRTYSRAQFERAWLKGSGGVVYVIHPESKKLPTASKRWR
ncbi:MAG: C39 family peptidase [Aeromicrobium erythreum]